ncbi:MAG: Na+/H+ antiporter NhaC family protein [Saprospiraceae bacterium]|nr:Na+/H+ antiporter NhaC family protein [Saprospiraceae bacterium]
MTFLLLLPATGYSQFQLDGDSKGALRISAPGLSGEETLVINGQEVTLEFDDGVAQLEQEVDHKGRLISVKSADGSLLLFHASRKDNAPPRIKRIPLWLSIIPPLMAIALALLFKEAVVSLFVGVWAGAFIAGGMRWDSLWGIFQSFFAVVDKYVITALTDSGHMSVIVFTILIGGMVAIISRNGGMAGVVKSLSKYAQSRRSTQFVTWLLGVAIFFDDYANTLIVGNTMRSVTDRFRISREKLAYIVDSTAAPVAAVAFITTWIGAELGYIDSGLAVLSNFEYEMTPYAVFINSLKYSFYPILTLAFILFLVYQRKDFGPMLKAEQRAYHQGQVSSAATPEEDEPNMEDLSPVAGAPQKWIHAAAPVGMVIAMTIVGLLSTGMNSLYDELSAIMSIEHSWSAIWSNMGSLFPEGTGGFFRKIGKLIGASDSYVALLWASVSGVVVAIGITLYGRIMSLLETIHTMTTGFKTMIPAFIILTLAWSLALTTEELHTADYLSSALEGNVNPFVLPVLTFVLSAFIAFSTGSSWSTMAILYPIVIPTTWIVCQGAGLESAISLEILLNVISVVLGASVLGDHCSPISDTTILSSLASDCNHIDHVRTQLPYALVVGVVSLTCCGLSTLLGGGWLISILLLLVSLALLYGIVWKFGQVVE